MTRRSLLFVAMAFPLRGDDAEQVWELFTELAAFLSEGNAGEFMKWFDRSMTGYESLHANVAGLLEQAEVQSSIELLGNEGNGAARTVELDWFMQIVLQQDAAGSTRRRERIRCRLVKQNKQWRIVALDPQEFFAPPKPVR